MAFDSLDDAGDLVATQRRTLAAMLARDPTAHLGALDNRGFFTDLPAEVRLGSGQGRLTGRTVVDLAVGEDAAVVIDAWEQLLQSGSAVCTVRLRADPEHTVSLRWFDVREAYDVFVVLLTTSDTTATRPAIVGDLVATSRPRVARIMKDPSATITSIDQATTLLLGFDPDEMVGERSLQFIHPDDQVRAIDNWIELVAAPEHVQRVRVRHRRASGSYLWVEIANSSRLDENGDGQVLTEMLDVSAEMAALEQLREREEVLNRLTEALPLALLHVDADDRILYRNRRVVAMTGVEEAETLHQQLEPIAQDVRQRLRAAIDEAILGGVPKQIELEIVSGADGRRVYDVRIRPLDDPDGDGGAVLCMTDITASADLRAELRDRATYDSLTGCLNRASTLIGLGRLLARPDPGLAVVYLDLDGFKRVNDEHGHAAGDAVLRSVADRLRTIVRSGDFVGRLGGDEFLVVSPSVSSSDEAHLLADRLEAAAVHRLEVGLATVQVLATTGVAWTNEAVGSADDLVAEADGAMYWAKNRKRRAVDGDSPALDHRLRSDRLLDLSRALDAGELELHYQPIMDLASGRAVGAEALLRWRRQGRVLPAGAFIELAERSGAILDIGAWAAQAFATQVAAARADLSDDFLWFVNLSLREVAASGAMTLSDQLACHQIPLSTVVVEITERATLQDGRHLADALDRLGGHGFTVALDDVGTGWSTQLTLSHPCVSWLKIDREVIAGAGLSDQPDEVIRTTVDTATELDLGVIAEGVETREQRSRVQTLGVELGQGFHFAPALPGPDLLRQLRQRNRPGPSGSPRPLGGPPQQDS